MSVDRQGREERSSFRDALREFAQEERHHLGEHPSIPELAAYRDRTLPEVEQERIADHLALCRTCRELVLELGEFEDPLPGGGEAPEGEPQTRAAWEALRARMSAGVVAEMSPIYRFEEEPLRSGARPATGAEAGSARGPRTGGEPEPGPRGAESRKTARWFRNRAALATAASLVLAVGGVYFGLHERSKREEHQRSRKDVYVVDLLPPEEGTRSIQEGAQVPARVKHFLLLIAPPIASPHREYQYEVLRGNQVVDQGELTAGIDQEDSGSLSIEFSREELSGGSYELVLRAGGQEVATYQFQVLSPQRSGPHP
jgi:hypothetical protein